MIRRGLKMIRKRWRKRRELPELITADAPLNDDPVELVFENATYDDLKALFEELDNEIEIMEERAENRADGIKGHKSNLYGKYI